MIKKFYKFIVILFILIHSSSIAGVSYGDLNQDGKDDFVDCRTENDIKGTNKICKINISGLPSKSVYANHYQCPYFDIRITKNNSNQTEDILQVDCSPPRNVTNNYYYTIDKDNANLILFKFKSSQCIGISSPDCDIDDFTVDSRYLYNLNYRLSYRDSNRFEPLYYGKILRKTYLYKEDLTKTKMYLIKSDKVLILEKKQENKKDTWYRVYYKGKKDIDVWIKASSLEIRS